MLYNQSKCEGPGGNEAVKGKKSFFFMFAKCKGIFVSPLIIPHFTDEETK